MSIRTLKYRISPWLLRQRLSLVKTEVKNSTSVLDLGCGHEKFLDLIPKKAKYLGIDIDKRLIEGLRKRRPQKEFLVADLERKIKVTKRKFDTVFLLALVEHLRSIDNLLASLQKLTHSKSKIVITTPTFFGYYLHRLFSFVGLVSRKAAKDHKKCYTRNVVKKLAHKHGFVLFRSKRFLFGLNQKFVLKKLSKIGVFTYDFYPSHGGAGKVAYSLFKYSKFQKKMIVFSTKRNNLAQHIRIKIPDIQIGRYKLTPILYSIYLNLFIHKLIKKYKLKTLIIHSGPGGLFLIRKTGTETLLIAYHNYFNQIKYLGSNFFYQLLFVIEERAYKIADKILCISRSTKKTILENYNLIKKKKVIYAPIGIDLKEFNFKKKVSKENRLLFVGQMQERKGPLLLVKAIVDIQKKGKLGDLSVDLVGEGPDLEKVSRLVKKNGLNSQVKMHGWVNRKKLLNLFQKDKYCVVPSVFEGFGLAALEAMASGCIVVGTNVPGLRDIIKDRENGFLLKNRTVRSLSSLLRSLFLGELKTGNILKKARVTASRYQWEKVVKILDGELKSFNWYKEC